MPTQPSGMIITITEISPEPTTPKIERLSSECVCPRVAPM